MVDRAGNDSCNFCDRRLGDFREFREGGAVSGGGLTDEEYTIKLWLLVATAGQALTTVGSRSARGCHG